MELHQLHHAHSGIFAIQSGWGVVSFRYTYTLLFIQYELVGNESL